MFHKLHTNLQTEYGMPVRAKAKDLADLFKVISDPNRVRILML